MTAVDWGIAWPCWPATYVKHGVFMANNLQKHGVFIPHHAVGQGWSVTDMFRGYFPLPGKSTLG